MKKNVLLALGWLFMVIAVVAIVVPLVPTTPFLILAAACFSKSSDKFHAWLLNHKYFGPPVADWDKNKVIRTKFKVIATLMVASSAIFVYPRESIPLFGKLGFTACVTLAMLYVWTRKSRP